ncbi:MAG TPA: DNA polymerase IV [Ktedonobacterales bacterium]
MIAESHVPATPDGGFRRVMHCDLDCFFAAVEELDDPSLRGKPVIVGGNPDGRGVVSTANYVARRYGVHSAMAAALARRLCPQAIFLWPRFERYRELSRRVMEILDDAFEVREQVSIDEAYGELPPGVPGCVPAEVIARELRAQVLRETGLTISVGVAQNKSLAKLASDICKPDGLYIVRPGSELVFLAPLSVGKLSGVGPHTRERLERMGIVTVGQLAQADMHDLERAFGKHGRWLHQLATARDDRPVVADFGPPKSISHEDTYARDLASLEMAEERIREQAQSVSRRAQSKNLRGRTVHLKVKWSDFSLMSRQCSLPHATDAGEEIAEAVIALLRAEVAPLLAEGRAIRLLGVGLHGIVAPREPAITDGLIQPPLPGLDLAS